MVLHSLGFFLRESHFKQEYFMMADAFRGTVDFGITSNPIVMTTFCYFDQCVVFWQQSLYNWELRSTVFNEINKKTKKLELKICLILKPEKTGPVP